MTATEHLKHQKQFALALLILSALFSIPMALMLYGIMLVVE